MLRMTISFALVLMCLLQPVAANGIAGWPLLRWGMTKQQVQKAYSNFEEFDKIGNKEEGGVRWVKALDSTAMLLWDA